MCLGIPGRIVGLRDGADLATADVVGTRRTVNVALVRDDDDGVRVGDWVLIHMGFAMEVIDEHEAAAALEGLELMGGGPAEPGPASSEA